MNRFLSPCVCLCELDEAGKYCIGCKRSEEEIFSWLTYDEKTRLKLLKEIAKRELK